MDFEYRHLIPADFAADSKVWIYQANRTFMMSEALQLEDMMQEFIAQWNSHGTPVKGYANLLFGQFIVLMADETASGVSGCSTDSSVRLIKQVEEIFKVDMFNRQNLAFLVKEKIQAIPMAQLGYAYENGFITADTIYFNNLVLTRQALLDQWMIPLKDSWLARRLPLTTPTK
jgi:hypothetical protein